MYMNGLKILFEHSMFEMLVTRWRPTSICSDIAPGAIWLHIGIRMTRAVDQWALRKHSSYNKVTHPSYVAYNVIKHLLSTGDHQCLVIDTFVQHIYIANHLKHLDMMLRGCIKSYILVCLLQAGLLSTFGALGLMLVLACTPHNPQNTSKRMAYLTLFAFLSGMGLGPLMDYVIRLDPRLVAGHLRPFHIDNWAFWN